MSNAIPSLPAWTAADLRRLVSPDRFARYLADAAGSLEAAAGLYAWSGRVAGAIYEELGMIEVVLRNILDCLDELRAIDQAGGAPASGTLTGKPARA